MPKNGRVAEPGLNWKMPYFDTVAGVVSLRVNQITLTMETKTKDNVFVTIPISVQTFGLLLLSNLFMTVAWYGHLKNLADKPWYVAAIISWGIALFEYLLQVPANRIGFQQAGFNVAQLKIMQEVITLTVFVPFAMVFMKQAFKWDFVWAGLCMVGAVYFIFRTD